jgi:tRNA-specific 2-thiouridylase
VLINSLILKGENLKALALFSGGLDSMLAIKLMTEQGIDVHALFLDTGFFGDTDSKEETLQSRAKMVGATFEIVDIRQPFIQNILFDPKYGYGKNFNPCIDCHAHMFRVAKALMEKYGASFIISGEVVGQRPMSQRMEALKQVVKLANEEENTIILRPLSAKILPKTKPELEGWVDVEKLLDIRGRGRNTQLSLAKKYGFKEYQSPGGGCLLTEQAFSNKLRTFTKESTLKLEDIELLKVGRYLKLDNEANLIIGRNKDENEKIQNIKNDDYIFCKATSLSGPDCLLSKNANSEDKNLAAKIILTYTKANIDERYDVQFGNEIITSSPFASKEEVKKWIVT